ncbi:MFS general substrate transporter [Botryosphaeria dothidea]|uniref:MFS general substrate transporter n=1 Tax=Botryosphaeria dothidea TaxID=55169 RepID=A0A8H4N5K7_9PEZI|nr:MFS general substrate transporter [Botryosphaeria dothidea]KAF4312253.1 MFS general substrate transporter [Botryosphaeria dothidea]
MTAQSQEKSAVYNAAYKFYRGTIFQAVILGLISFTQPGIWTALNNLGAGGQAEPYVVNAANVITFVVMVVFSPLASIVGNIIGMRWVVLIGCIGYVPYSAALYCNSVWGTQWFLIFGSVTCGLSASALWPAEAAIGVGYPEVQRRGLCISIWMALGKLGSIIGTAIQLAINKDGDQTGAIAPKTYLVLVALQCLGLPLAFLISPPHKLIREDGKTPTFSAQSKDFKTQTLAFLRLFKRKEVILLIPAFITAQWGVTYQGNYLTAYFTVRARALAGFLIAVTGALTNLLTGWWLDTKYLRRTTQARWSWFFTLALFTGTWIWNIVVQVRWAEKNPEIDWNSSNFGAGVGIYIIYRIAYEIIGVWLYWALGSFDTEADTIALSMGILRSGESAGQAFAYAVGSVKSASLMTNLIVAVVTFYVAVPFTTWAAFLVRDRAPGEEGEDSGSEDVVQVTGSGSDAEAMRVGVTTKL